jgi:hypothetical protein
MLLFQRPNFYGATDGDDDVFEIDHFKGAQGAEARAGSDAAKQSKSFPANLANAAAPTASHHYANLHNPEVRDISCSLVFTLWANQAGTFQKLKSFAIYKWTNKSICNFLG